MTEARYSSPGTPFHDLQNLGDDEVLQKLRSGAVLHFKQSIESQSTLRYEEGEWVFSSTDKKSPQRFKNLLQFMFRFNGLSGAAFTQDGDDYDVTIEDLDWA